MQVQLTALLAHPRGAILANEDEDPEEDRLDRQDERQEGEGKAWCMSQSRVRRALTIARAPAGFSLEYFQNWRSKFLAIAAMVIFSILLRQ